MEVAVALLRQFSLSPRNQASSHLICSVSSQQSLDTVRTTRPEDAEGVADELAHLWLRWVEQRRAGNWSELPPIAKEQKVVPASESDAPVGLTDLYVFTALVASRMRTKNWWSS